MPIPRFASVLLLAALLPAARSSDVELKEAIEAEANADTECAADDCSSALSLLQIGQKPTQKGADAGAATAAAGGSKVDPNSAGAKPLVHEALEGSWFGGAYTASQTCYGYTGGSCNFEDCNAERNAVCRARRCVCESSCAGPDGKCHRGQTNVPVARGFRLRNVKWPKYSMYWQEVSVTGQLKTTDSYSFLNLGKDKFSLFKLPGNGTNFFLGSVAYSDKVARIAHTSGTAISSYGLYSTDVHQGKSPWELALTVCYDHAKAGLRFGSNDGHRWAYIHHGSWLVYATEGSPASIGDGGLWTLSPALEPPQIAMLPKC